jgi:hypothetical protein
MFVEKCVSDSLGLGSLALSDSVVCSSLTTGAFWLAELSVGAEIRGIGILWELLVMRIGVGDGVGNSDKGAVG